MPRDQVLFFDDDSHLAASSRDGSAATDSDVVVTVLENSRAAGFNSTLLSAGIVALFETPVQPPKRRPALP